MTALNQKAVLFNVPMDDWVRIKKMANRADLPLATYVRNLVMEVVKTWEAEHEATMETKV